MRITEQVCDEYIGSTIGNWFIQSVTRINKRLHFLVKCFCGRISVPTSYHVINRLTSACNSCAPKKHGLYHSPTWNSWSGAKNRCNNIKNKDFSSYGGRGIQFSPEWNKFENFVRDMGIKPLGLTLDRIDNNGNYEPGNCRWTTMSVQNSNQRKRHSFLNNLGDK